MTPQQEPKILLIVGAAGAFAQHVAHHLKDRYQVVGLDTNTFVTEFPGPHYKLDYTKRALEEVFRKHHFWGVLHLGRIRSTSLVKSQFRYNQNILGTRHILQHAFGRGVRNFFVMSTHTVYGAQKDNPFYIEESAALRATSNIPEYRDTVEFDHEAVEFLWKHQRKAKTMVLRPNFIVGPHVRSPLMKSLRSRYSPTLVGFDPLVQFIHEDDMLRVFDAVLETPRTGVYNVGSEEVIPYSKAIKATGGRVLPVPGALFPWIFKGGGYGMPKNFLNILRYPIVISTHKLKTDYNLSFMPLLEVLHSLKKSIR